MLILVILINQDFALSTLFQKIKSLSIDRVDKKWLIAMNRASKSSVPQCSSVSAFPSTNCLLMEKIHSISLESNQKQKKISADFLLCSTNINHFARNWAGNEGWWPQKKSSIKLSCLFCMEYVILRQISVGAFFFIIFDRPPALFKIASTLLKVRLLAGKKF